jgi:hypothetical protein
MGSKNALTELECVVDHDGRCGDGYVWLHNQGITQVMRVAKKAIFHL